MKHISGCYAADRVICRLHICTSPNVVWTSVGPLLDPVPSLASRLCSKLRGYVWGSIFRLSDSKDLRFLDYHTLKPFQINSCFHTFFYCRKFSNATKLLLSLIVDLR